MALQNVHVTTALTIRYKDGIDSTGKDIVKGKKFSNVKVTATDENIYATAMAISDLMQYSIDSILRTDDNALVNG